MKITIISVGKIKKNYTLEWENELTKRVSPYTTIEFIEVKEEPITANKSIDIVKEREGDNILKFIPERSYVIALTPKGKEFSSEEFAKKVQQIQLQNSHITFIIGGPAGLHSSVLSRANLKLSFSKFTFTHQVIRVLLLEQLYRTFCILNNRPYHL